MTETEKAHIIQILRHCDYYTSTQNVLLLIKVSHVVNPVAWGIKETQPFKHSEVYQIQYTRENTQYIKSNFWFYNVNIYAHETLEDPNKFLFFI
jgi:hypothetical protein